MMIRFFSALFAFALITCAAMPAFALPEPWNLGFQGEASPSAERIHDFHHLLLYIITAITIFVLALLVWVVIRYNKWVNPVPQQFSHNVLIEVIWTVVPVLILLVIAIPSFRLLYYVDRTEDYEMTLKVTGNQWNWSYEYPDNGGISFTSYMIPEKDIDKEKGQLRLLSTDNPVYLPVDTNIQILVTASDVIHAFALPELGVKIDAMPGHTNETWVRITRPGTYYGQCSELCGKDHAYMPIEVIAVSKEEFADWVAGQNAPKKN
jgi:cytochrome c oxidase subunit II